MVVEHVEYREVIHPPVVESMMGQMRTENLSVFYGRTRQALFDVTLEMPARSITALIGPSGCGKSTFIRALNRMNEVIPGTVTTGRVYLDDIQIYDKRVDVVLLRRLVGMVFQRPNPFPRSIWENIAYGPRLAGIRKRSELDRIVEESLRKAALWDEVKDRLHESALGLSGGQQQRLCIARALAVNPRVLLLDEPAAALDPIATGRIEELLLQLKEELTIVIVTHNLQQAGRIADRTAFFLLGQLIEVGPTARIFENPGDERTEAYVTGRFG